MAYLVKADLKTKMYGAEIDQITRADDTIVTSAINAGISEVKSYLSRYNRTKLFNPEATGYVADVNLLEKTKAVVCWNLILLSNPNISLDLFRTAYEDAIAWLKSIQKGQADPEGWPYPDDDDDTDPFNENNNVQWQSNTKRGQHY